MEHHFGISTYDMTVDINIYQMAEYLVFQNFLRIADLVSKRLQLQKITQDILYIIKKSNKFYIIFVRVKRFIILVLQLVGIKKKRFSSN